jgi:hypothetical protein
MIDATPWPPTAVAVALTAALGWDAWCGGRVARLVTLAPAARLLGGLVALLALPAGVLALASGSFEMARAVREVLWIWPLVCTIAVVAPLFCLSRDRSGKVLAWSAFVWNLLVATGAWTRALAGAGVATPDALVAIAGLPRALLAGAVGDAALSAPWAVLPPLLVPAWPPKWRATRVLRAGLTGVCLAGVAGMLAMLLPTWHAVTSYARYDDDPLRERTEADFAIGMRVFNTIDAAPPPSAVARADVSTSEALETTAILVVVKSSVRAATLDSVARALDARTKAGNDLLVLVQPDASGTVADDDAVRVTRRLRPQVLILGESARAVGVEAWAVAVRRAATAARAADAEVQIAVPITRRDSARYAWATSTASAVESVVLLIEPSRLGAGGLDAERETFARWMAAAHVPRTHWVWDRGGVPAAHGDESQRRAALGAITWGTGFPRVRGVIVGDAGDHGAITGVMSATGAWRPAAGLMLRVAQTLHEAMPAATDSVPPNAPQ